MYKCIMCGIDKTATSAQPMRGLCPDCQEYVLDKRSSDYHRKVECDIARLQASVVELDRAEQNKEANDLGNELSELIMKIVDNRSY